MKFIILLLGVLGIPLFDFTKNVLPRVDAVIRFTEQFKSTTLNRKKLSFYPKPKWKKKHRYKVPNFALKGTQAKDHRFSNQKKLRRMYRNS